MAREQCQAMELRQGEWQMANGKCGGREVPWLLLGASLYTLKTKQIKSKQAQADR
jgi:hypothetical protein